MQVFKSYFKVLNKYKGQMIMYIGIFFGIIFGFILPNQKDPIKEYTETASNFAVYDYDNSVISQHLVDYLATKNNIQTIKADENDIIQDALYYDDIDLCLRIPAGFGDAVANGNANDYLEIVAIPNATASSIFESELNTYLNVLSTYINAGYDVDTALAKTESALATSINISLPTGEKATGHGKPYYLFNYLAWIMIMIVVMGVCPVLIVYNNKEIKNRIQCSAYKFSNFNKELLLGVAVTGIIICLIFSVIAVMALGSDMLSASGALYALNALCYTILALSIAFLISKVCGKIELLNLFANIIALGMSFLCGVFVPSELLGDNVINVSRFLPAYWYTQAVSLIDSGTIEFSKLGIDLGMQLLFAVVFCVLAFVLANKRTVAES